MNFTELGCAVHANVADYAEDCTDTSGVPAGMGENVFGYIVDFAIHGYPGIICVFVLLDFINAPRFVELPQLPPCQLGVGCD